MTAIGISEGSISGLLSILWQQQLRRRHDGTNLCRPDGARRAVLFTKSSDRKLLPGWPMIGAEDNVKDGQSICEVPVMMHRIK